MNKLDALWEYQQAELALEKIEARIKTTPSRQKLNKLHAFLSEQQTLITGFQKQIDARSASVDKLAAQIAEFEHQYELELSEFNTMENDEECTAAEMTESRRALERLLNQVDAVRRELYDTLAWIEKATADYKKPMRKPARPKRNTMLCANSVKTKSLLHSPSWMLQKLAAQKRRAEVDPALLKKYDSVKTHHAVPMARVENNQCGGLQHVPPHCDGEACRCWHRAC